MKKFIFDLKRKIKRKIKQHTEKQEKKLPRIIVDSAVPLSDLLEASDLDRYDAYKFNESNFPQKFNNDKTELLVRTFCFKNRKSSEEIIKFMNKVGFRPVTIYELLVIILRYPTFCKNSKYVFTALGSKFNNLDDESITVPSIMILEGMEKKVLSLRDWDSAWSGSSRIFIGVRRVRAKNKK